MTAPPTAPRDGTSTSPASDAGASASTAASLMAAHAAAALALTCGRCRRRTNEVVTKLCTCCSLPLHASCVQEVAARECGLAFGFQVPNAFCSKRCYEADLMSHAASTTTTSSSTPSNSSTNGVFVMPSATSLLLKPAPVRRTTSVPNEIHAALTIKIGDVHRTSRKQLTVVHFRFLVSEGFEVFKAKVNTRTQRELQNHRGPELYVRDDMAIYIRPGVHSKQAELVELTDKNFEPRIARSYRNFLKRKISTDPPPSDQSSAFECDILTYVRKEPSGFRRSRASSSSASTSSNAATTLNDITPVNQQHLMTTSSSSASAAAAAAVAAAMLSTAAKPSASNTIPNFLELTGEPTTTSNDPLSPTDGTNGSTKRKYHQMAEIAACLPETTSSSTAATSTSPSTSSSQAYKSVRMILNGSVVSVQVNVRDVLNLVGSMMMMQQIQFPSTEDTTASSSTSATTSTSDVSTQETL